MEFFLLFSFSVLEKIIVQGYKALGLQYFFTAGPDEVKAWTIQVTEKKKNVNFVFLKENHLLSRQEAQNSVIIGF